VLFVDVAGSTERLSELGDRHWRELLDRFEETVRRTLVAHRGGLVSRSGDSVLATFDGPARAIRCAWDSATPSVGPGWTCAAACTRAR
jgi:class 3 adenylate cyclase